VKRVFSHKTGVQSIADVVRWRIKIRLHQFNISWSRSQYPWSPLLCLPSVVACPVFRKFRLSDTCLASRL